MSKHRLWVFETKQEAQEACDVYKGHPYVSIGEPIESNGQWLCNVTLWECD